MKNELIDNPSQMLDSLRSLSKTRMLSHIERLNLRLLEADLDTGFGQVESSEGNDDRIRVAILSLLFNWPSTGGGIVHTAELATFLDRSGYCVQHFYAKYDPWRVGQVESELSYPTCPITFSENEWCLSDVTSRFRREVDRFAPNFVIITDSWNSKPHLAAAMDGYPYFIRLAALECICPLNNVRLLIGERGMVKQCIKTQLATPTICQKCVDDNQHLCGQLHVDEREFSQFHTPGYADILQNAFASAAGILAVNPLIATLCEPYSQAVHVVPSGFDPDRFLGLQKFQESRPFRFLFAGLTEEYMKGFQVLLQACQMLWHIRQDFELHVTADDTNHGHKVPFIRYRGWQDQTSLPKVMAECHAVIVPTVAQEALGRTAVEAMGAARAVIASRIGGLPFTVTDGLTGLLFQPSDSSDLSKKMVRLMDEPGLAESLGRNGQNKFSNEHTWDVIIDQHYRPLFSKIRNNP